MDLTALFSPKSIAIIGASKQPEKVGAIVLKNAINSGFKGHIYPVNPGETTISNLKSYPDVASLPEVPDLAIIAIPNLPALEVLTQIGEAGIKNVVIYTAGFKEVGEEGKKLEDKLAEIAQKYDLNVLGPNCFGFVNNLCPINVTFGEPAREPGNLRFISQSGALAASLFDWCQSQNIGFSDFVTLGNKTVINENDVLKYFRETAVSLPKYKGLASVHPIGLYLESIADGPEFIKITSDITKTDPVFIIKPGKTAAAASAMKSHTGSIAGEDYILEEALKEAGITRCNTLEDFFDLSRAFSWEDAPEGPRVAIVSNAGGPSVICADALASEGLEIAKINDKTKEQLLAVLPRSASILNPIDVLGDALADRFAKAAEIILQTDQVDSLVVILTPQVMTQIKQTAEALGVLSEKYQKPIFCSFIGGIMVAEGEQVLNDYKIPSFRFPERAISAIGAMWRFKQRQSLAANSGTTDKNLFFPNNHQIKTTVDKAIELGHQTLDNLEANRILSLAEIPTPETKGINSLDEAESFANDFGWPVVLKLSSPGLLHKRKVGGVITGIKNQELLEAAWDTIQRKITYLTPAVQEQVGFQIQKEVEGGVEVIVGVKRDPTFGPILLFGAGGSLVELISDRNLHLLPLNLKNAQELVEHSKAYTILKGREGEPPYALDKLYELLVRLGKLMEILPEVSDIEINPVIVTLNNVWAVDGKVILVPKTIGGPKFQVATTLSHEILASKYHYFKFEASDPLKAAPGQYISVKVASDRINCYSIAGKTDGNDFNLLVDTLPGGPGSKFFENLEEGGKITYLGPFGTFTLKPHDGAAHLLFIGTGCGIAPLVCQIEAALKQEHIKIPISLYWGLSAASDVFFENYFRKLAEDFPNFTYQIVVHESDPNWNGATGFVTEYIEADFPDATFCSAYLCGNKKMIEDVTKLLADRGCPRERIYTEKF